MLIHGKCHCGNISFSLLWEPDPIEIPARACTCSFCTRNGGVWASDPKGALKIAIKESSLVSRYAFGTKTAEFLICVRCGVVPLVISRIDGQHYAVVNVSTFDGIDQSLLGYASVNVESEDEVTRLARRKRNWIADVRYTETEL
ncbi:MAG: GFA family protein [Gammaproteobacteria bacterium]